MKNRLNAPLKLQMDGYSCGFIASRVLLETYDIEYNKKFLREELELTNEGLELSKMREVLANYGLHFRKISDKFPSIKRQIDNGCPILVGSKPNKRGSSHWSTIYGYDDHDQSVYIINHIVGPSLSKFYRKFLWDNLLAHIKNDAEDYDAGLFAVHCYETKAQPIKSAKIKK